MRVHVVSDVHGNAADLAHAGDGADALICLGDLIGFIDYQDHGSGIMGDLFGAEAVGELIRLRSERKFAEARDYSRGLWAGVEGDRTQVMMGAVGRQYEELFAAFPNPTYLTYGNVDLPHLYPEYMRDGLTLLDGEVVEIGGWTFGFVGGGLKTPMNTPFEIPDDEYAAKVEAIGAVDVLCSHIPPNLAMLTYDTLGRRYERGSRAVLEAIRKHQPRYNLFGHVHQPYSPAVTIGRTVCANVGHFNATGTPYVLEW